MTKGNGKCTFTQRKKIQAPRSKVAPLGIWNLEFGIWNLEFISPDGTRFKRVSPQKSNPSPKPASVSLQTWQRLNHHPSIVPQVPIVPLFNFLSPQNNK